MLFAASFFQDVMLDGMNQKSPARAPKSAGEKTSASFVKLLDNISAAKKKQPEIKTAENAGKYPCCVSGGDGDDKEPSNIAEFRIIKCGKNEKIKGKGNNNTAEGYGREEATGAENGDFRRNSGILIQCVSQLLNVKPEEIMFLFESGGTKVQDIFSGIDARDIISELAAIAGLNGYATQAIQDIAALVEKYAVEKAGNLDSTAGRTETGTDFKKEAQTPDGGHFSLRSGELDIESLMTGDEEAPEKYAGIAEKLKAGFEELLSKIKDKHEGMPFVTLKEEKDSIKQPAAAQEVFGTLLERDDFAGSEIKQGYRGYENGRLKKEGQQDVHFGENLEGKNPASGHAANAGQRGGKIGWDERVPSFSNNWIINTQVVKSEPAGKFEILPGYVPPNREQLMPGKEILGRIVENARIILDGSKSEMVMQLKPESLGKLSLKVVAEHGIVTARFMVENMQVKQIIETNMQVLKDALEKQGLSVEGFSVSVGQEQQNWLHGDNDFIWDGIRNSTRVANLRQNIPEGDDFDKHRRMNLYELNGSSIDLMA